MEGGDGFATVDGAAGKAVVVDKYMLQSVGENRHKRKQKKK
jgi:hypothetical protein